MSRLNRGQYLWLHSEKRIDVAAVAFLQRLRNSPLRDFVIGCSVPERS